jgi:hypothetical protein
MLGQPAATTLRPQDHDPRLTSGYVSRVTAGQGWSRLSESNRRPAHYDEKGAATAVIRSTGT